MAGIKDITIHPEYVAISERLHNQLVQTKFGSFTQYMYYSHVPSL